jgi:hypothetical protein
MHVAETICTLLIRAKKIYTVSMHLLDQELASRTKAAEEEQPEDPLLDPTTLWRRVALRHRRPVSDAA